MPETAVFFFREPGHGAPAFDWLLELRHRQSKAFAACLARLRLLKMQGFELRRPAADYLQDGIYELRAKHGTVQLRLLYFFHGRNIAVVAHGLTKEKRVPPADLARAIERRRRYEQNPTIHRFPQGIEAFETSP